MRKKNIMKTTTREIIARGTTRGNIHLATRDTHIMGTHKRNHSTVCSNNLVYSIVTKTTHTKSKRQAGRLLTMRNDDGGF